MSLRVWLPLSGDLRNQGLSDFIVEPIVAPTYVAGKIGKCYQRANSSSQLTNGLRINDNLVDLFGNQASIAIWVKPLGTHTHYNGTFISSGNWNQQKWAFGVSQDNTKVDVLCGSYNNYIDCAVPVNEWTHLVSVFDNGTCKLYKNGVYVGEKTGQAAFKSDATWTGIGRETYAGGYFGFNGCLNDLRIYDHCLSEKEIKEIAKGLILHYKLDDAYNEQSTFLTSTIHNTTAYNSALGKYGYNEASNLIKTTGQFQGKDCIKVATIQSGQSAQPYVYFSNLFTSNGTNAPAYKALSFDYYTTCPTTKWLNIYKLGSGTGTASWKTISSIGTRQGTYANSSNSILVQPNEWNHIEVIFHGDTDKNAEWGYCINGPRHTSNEDYYFLFANIQLEENDHVTGYGQGLHTTVVTDCSGYGHNGDIVGDLSVINDTPRYMKNTVLGSNSAIKVSTNSWMPQGMEAMTINVWAKNTSWAGKHVFSCTESGGFNTEGGESGYLRFPINVYTNAEKTSHSYKYDSKEIEISKLSTTDWNMLTFVYDNTGIRTYINGELHHTHNYTSYGIFFNTNARLFLGCEANSSSPSAPYFNGSLSDFRIYCTVLTDDDIKELYQTSASIDNKQNFYGREFSDTLFDTTSITKAGIVLADDFVEDTLALIKDDRSIESNCFYEY